MKSLKGTKTAENLMKSFAGECQARTRYTYYASIAKKQGYVQISNIFMETAEQEKEHAKRFYKLLKEDFSDSTSEIRLYISAISSNPSSFAIFAKAGYNSVHSSFSPSAAAFKFLAVS